MPDRWLRWPSSAGAAVCPSWRISLLGTHVRVNSTSADRRDRFAPRVARVGTATGGRTPRARPARCRLLAPTTDPVPATRARRRPPRPRPLHFVPVSSAGVAELADAPGLGPGVQSDVGVRVPPPAQAVPSTTTGRETAPPPGGGPVGGAAVVGSGCPVDQDT